MSTTWSRGIKLTVKNVNVKQATGGSDVSACEHKHTGSCSPEGVYLYVRCMDCGEMLAISKEGSRRLAACQGYNPDKVGRSQTCNNCGFDFWDHKE